MALRRAQRQAHGGDRPVFPLGQLSAQRRSGELGVARMGQKNGLLARSQLDVERCWDPHLE